MSFIIKFKIKWTESANLTEFLVIFFKMIQNECSRRALFYALNMFYVLMLFFISSFKTRVEQTPVISIFPNNKGNLIQVIFFFVLVELYFVSTGDKIKNLISEMNKQYTV